jgi:flagellar hook-associated protein 2
MGITPLVFTGVSQFSSDFQTIVDRAVAIAQLPVKSLQNQQTNIIQQKVLAGNLNSAVADLAAAVAALGTIGSNQGIAASSSDTAAVAVESSYATTPATYTISDITSIAKTASETSIKGYASGTSAVSATGSMQLIVGTKTYSITLAPEKNNLAGLRDAINGLNAGVYASVLTTGTGDTPDYLSVSAAGPGATTLSLLDAPANTPVPFLTAANQGDGSTPASETSLNSFATADATPVSSAGTMSLQAGSQTYTITLDAASNNLNGLAQAINNLGVGLTATVQTGAGDKPYSLSIAASSPGALSLGDIPNDPPAAILTSNNQGSDTVFKLNGVAVSRPTTLINDVVPGISFSVLDTTEGTKSVTLTLRSDRGKLSSALQDLVTKYNAVRDLVNAQIGPSAGLLSGNTIVRATQEAMRSLVNFQGTGALKSLTDLGIELSRTGEMSFNQSTAGENEICFDKLSDSTITSAFSFLGSSETGFGALSKRLTQISDPVTGLIRAQQNQFDATDARISAQVSTLTERISLMQTSLRSKLQKIDTLLAGLESQQNVLTASIDSLNYSLYGKKDS